MGGQKGCPSQNLLVLHTKPVHHLHRPEIGLNSDLIWRGIRNGKVSNLHLFMLPGLMTIPMDVSASIMTAKYQLINDGGACGGSLPARSQIGDP